MVLSIDTALQMLLKKASSFKTRTRESRTGPTRAEFFIGICNARQIHLSINLYPLPCTFLISMEGSSERYLRSFETKTSMLRVVK